jgi:hypothetical protein
VSRSTRLNGRVGLLDLPKEVKDVTGKRLAEMNAVAYPPNQRAFLPLSAPNLKSSTAAFDYAIRTLVQTPRRTVWWRIGFANANRRSSVIPDTPVQITNVGIGSPVFATSAASGARWAGDCTGALKSISGGSLNVPTNGTWVWAPKNYTAADQIDPAAGGKVISWGHLNAAVGSGVAYGDSFQVYRATGNGKALDASMAGATLTLQGLLDVAIEYETEGGGRHFLVIGDSNALGLTTSPTPGFPQSGIGSLPHESWPFAAGKLGGFTVTSLAVGSTTIGEYGSSAYLATLWNRFDLTGIQFDGAFCSVGTNGLSDASFNAFVGDVLSVNSRLRALGVPRILWTDIPPRGLSAMYATVQTAAAAGATTLVTSSQLTLSSTNQLTIGSGYSAEDVTVASGPTGSGPYTYTLSTGLTYAHAVGESVVSANERARRRQNWWLGGRPDGIDGLISFEAALEKSPESPFLDPRIVSNDFLHFARAAVDRRAERAVAAAVQPKFATAPTV